MNINELKQKRSELIDSMQTIIETAQTEKRNRNDEEIQIFVGFETEIKNIDEEIRAIETVEELNKKMALKEPLKKEEKRMNIYSKLVEARKDGDFRFEIETRAIDVTSGLYSETVLNEIYSAGETPLYTKMGIKLLPNLVGNVKLPKIAATLAGKVAPGTASNNANALGSVDIIPNETFRLSETISTDMAKNDVLVNSIINELIKGVDRKIFQEIFTVALAGATVATGTTAITLANTYVMENLIDVENVAYLSSKEAFATGRGLSIEAGNATKLFKKLGNNRGETFEGTPLFYSAAIAKQLIYGDMQSIVLGDWGTIEVGFEYKNSLGQVIVTVSKKAAVVYRGVNSLVKTVIA